VSNERDNRFNTVVYICDHTARSCVPTVCVGADGAVYDSHSTYTNNNKK
jgi:hypothetical protein